MHEIPIIFICQKLAALKVIYKTYQFRFFAHFVILLIYFGEKAIQMVKSLNITAVDTKAGKKSIMDKKQCEFCFCFKECPNCNAENDIAARRCHQYQAILVDPDDMLKAALKLKNSLILRCDGMQLTTGYDKKEVMVKGHLLTYYDEGGSSVSELFRLTTPVQRKVFEQHFLLLHQ